MIKNADRARAPRHTEPAPTVKKEVKAQRHTKEIHKCHEPVTAATATALATASALVTATAVRLTPVPAGRRGADKRGAFAQLLQA